MKRMRFGAAVRLALALLLALACTLPFPTAAFAVVNFGTVSVSVPSTMTLTPGQSASVGCTVSPAMDMQTPNCETDYCPSGCELSTGAGCQDANGNCICFSSSYSPYYSSASVTSSNPSVARATYANGTLNVTGFAPGTCTVTVYGQLRMWTTGMGTMQVTVADAGSSAGASAGSSGVSAGSGASGGSADAGSGSGGGTNVVTVTTVGSSNMAAAAQAVAQGTASEEVVELTAEDGSAVIVVEAGDKELAGRELAKIAGTDGTCTFWSGGTIDAPLVTWTFSGKTLDARANLSIDPSVTVTQKGSGDVASLLADVADSVVLEFAHEGQLPGPAELGVNVGSVYDDGAKLGLHLYDPEDSSFALMQGGITVTDGMAQFTLDHCSTWALSTTDLSTLGGKAELAETGSAPEVPWGVVAGVVGGVVVLVAVVATVLVRKRKRATVA